MGAGFRAVFFQGEFMKILRALRLAFEQYLQPIKWGWIVQNGFFLQGACSLYAAIHFVRSVPILQVVNGVQMLKFDLGAAPSDFSPSPPGRKLRGTQRPGTLLKNGDFPQPVVSSNSAVQPVNIKRFCGAACQYQTILHYC